MNVKEIMDAIQREAASMNQKSGCPREARDHVDIALVDKLGRKIAFRKILSVFGRVRRVYSLPFVGYVIKTFVNYARLTSRLNQIISDAEAARQRLNHIESELAKVQKTVAFCLLKVGEIEPRSKDNFAKLQSHADRFKKNEHEMEGVKNKIQYILTDIGSLSTSLSEVSGKVGASAPPSLNMDGFYYDFEKRFRGPESGLTEKLQQYLKVVKKVSEKLPESAFLDVGCGRGEWLNILKEHNIKAMGIDQNAFMVDEAIKDGLSAVKGDAIEYLKKQEPGSLCGISGFHIVEHLPFMVMINLFDQAYRALAPGGILIFETPNPENIRVGTCNFYTDPTHLNPIPPHTLSFIAEHRGFENITLQRSSPINDDYALNIPKGEIINEWFNKEQDYAIIAYKPLETVTRETRLDRGVSTSN